jgi:UTP--glucose-1-phosphate uridylyltransferase
MRLLSQAKPSVGGEIQLTDSLDAVLADEEMYAVVIDPESGFDAGTVQTWLEANVVLALRDPELGPKVRALLCARYPEGF